MGLKFSSLKEDKSKKYKKLKKQSKRKKKKKTEDKENVPTSLTKEQQMQRVLNEWSRSGKGTFDYGSKLTNLANLNSIDPNMRNMTRVSSYGRNNQVRFVTPQINQCYNQHPLCHRSPQQFGNFSQFKNSSNNILSCNQNVVPMQPQKVTTGIVLNNGKYEAAFDEGDFVGGRYCSENYRRLNNEVEKMNSKVPSWLDNKKQNTKDQKSSFNKSVKVRKNGVEASKKKIK